MHLTFCGLESKQPTWQEQLLLAARPGQSCTVLGYGEKGCLVQTGTKRTISVYCSQHMIASSTQAADRRPGSTLLAGSQEALCQQAARKHFASMSR